MSYQYPTQEKSIHVVEILDQSCCTSFDPTLSCAIGEDSVRDVLVLTDVSQKLVERLAKKPQKIDPDCLFENAENILHFYEEDIVLHLVRQEVKDNRVYKLLQRGEDDIEGSVDMTRIARSSYLGKNPFGDVNDTESAAGLESEQMAPLHNL